MPIYLSYTHVINTRIVLTLIQPDLIIDPSVTAADSDLSLSICFASSDVMHILGRRPKINQSGFCDWKHASAL